MVALDNWPEGIAKGHRDTFLTRLMAQPAWSGCPGCGLL